MESMTETLTYANTPLLISLGFCENTNVVFLSQIWIVSFISFSLSLSLPSSSTLYLWTLVVQIHIQTHLKSGSRLFLKAYSSFQILPRCLGDLWQLKVVWRGISIIWEMKQMKQNYRKLVPLICPDQGTGFGIVEAVIMAETESSRHNMAFVKARRQDAGTSHTPFRQTGLAVTASHTHTLTLWLPHTCTATHPKAQRRKP